MTLFRIPHTYDVSTESWSSFSAVSGLKDSLAASEIPVKSSIGLSVTFSVDFRPIKEPIM